MYIIKYDPSHELPDIKAADSVQNFQGTLLFHRLQGLSL